MSKGFTLIEVMISVLIISIVIMALLQIRGNNFNVFLNLEKQLHMNQINSFIISNKLYGFESKSTTLDKFLDDFKIENNLRKKLKNTKVKVTYQKLDSINIDSGVTIEVGKTTLKIQNSSSNLVRLRVK